MASAGSVTFSMALPNSKALRALEEVAAKANQVGQKVQKAFGGGVTPKMPKMPAGPSGMAGMGGSLASGGASLVGQLGGALGITAGIAGVMGFGKAVFDASKNVEALRNQLTFATGSSTQMQSEMGFLTKASKDLGLDLLTTANAYAKLAGATRGTAMEGQKTRDIFMGISMAGTVLHMSSEQMERSLYAVQQMASKGTVSSEELKQQLGDSLPGALNIAARAMNMPIGQFNKMLAKGEILSEEFLPRFSKQLQKEFAGGVEQASKSAQASLNRFTTAFDLLKLEIGDAGFTSVFRELLDSFTGLLERLRSKDWQPFLIGLKTGIYDARDAFNDLKTSIGDIGPVLKGSMKLLLGFANLAYGIAISIANIRILEDPFNDEFRKKFPDPLVYFARAFGGGNENAIQAQVDAMYADFRKQDEKAAEATKKSPTEELDKLRKKRDEKTKAALADRNALTGTISGQRPQIVNINIDQLIRGFEVHTQTLNESMPEVRRIVVETLLDTINNTARYAPAS
jgi:tape measure domain-containing protein